jgi:hypothetical protein
MQRMRQVQKYARAREKRFKALILKEDLQYLMGFFFAFSRFH